MNVSQENFLIFNLNYEGETRQVEFLDYDTVEDLKLKIFELFNIPIHQQVIEGWRNEPECDKTVLIVCSRQFVQNYMKITKNDYSNTYVEHQNDHLETDCAKSCVKYIASYFITSKIKFETKTLEQLLLESCFVDLPRRRVLMLYLHVEGEKFSKTFCESLTEEKTKKVMENFCNIGWDISNMKYHNVLVNSLNKNNLENIASLVDSKVSAVIFIVNIDGVITPKSCLTGDKISKKDILKSVQDVEKFLKNEIEKETKLKEIENATSCENDMNSTRYQQLMADMLGDRDYDSFEFDQHPELKDKIGFSLFGPPQEVKGYDEKQIKIIQKLYDVVKEQSNEVAEFLDQVEISFIYNCLEPLPEEKVNRSKKFSDYNPNIDLMPFPVFVLRKCRNSNNSCRIFIDDIGRVYDTWQDYIQNNKLPEGIMIFPSNGRYCVNETGKVKLERCLSPACSINLKILKGADIASTGLGLASGGVFMATLLTPVAPAVLVAAGITGAGVGIYGIGRSIYTLVDRSIHKESMSFANSEARGAYLNIVAGSLGFFGAGANMAVAQLAARGTNISQGAIYAVNTLGVVNLGAGGANLINSGYDVFSQWYHENRTPSLLTLVQLSSSVLFFGNAVYNFRSVSSIIEETQSGVLQEYQDGLRSNRHRKAFDKLTKETIRQNEGNAFAGRAEIIKAVRNIPNKDEVFASLVRNNKQMNKLGIKFSAKDGNIQLNGHNVDMNSFTGMNRQEANLFLSKMPVKSNVTTLDKSNISKIYASNDFSVNHLNNLITYSVKIMGFYNSDVQNKIVKALAILVAMVFEQFTAVLDEIFPNSDHYSHLLKIVMQFFATQAEKFERQYQQWEATSDPEYYSPLFNFVNIDTTTRLKKFFEISVNICFNEGGMKEEYINKLLAYGTDWMAAKLYWIEEERQRDENRREHSAKFRRRKVNCKVCNGFYFSSNKN